MLIGVVAVAKSTDRTVATEGATISEVGPPDAMVVLVLVVDATTIGSGVWAFDSVATVRRSWP